MVRLFMSCPSRIRRPRPCSGGTRPRVFPSTPGPARRGPPLAIDGRRCRHPSRHRHRVERPATLRLPSSRRRPRPSPHRFLPLRRSIPDRTLLRRRVCRPGAPLSPVLSAASAASLRSSSSICASNAPEEAASSASRAEAVSSAVTAPPPGGGPPDVVPCPSAASPSAGADDPAAPSDDLRRRRRHPNRPNPHPPLPPHRKPGAPLPGSSAGEVASGDFSAVSGGASDVVVREDAQPVAIAVTVTTARNQVRNRVRCISCCSPMNRPLDRCNLSVAWGHSENCSKFRSTTGIVKDPLGPHGWSESSMPGCPHELNPVIRGRRMIRSAAVLEVDMRMTLRWVSRADRGADSCTGDRRQDRVSGRREGRVDRQAGAGPDQGSRGMGEPPPRAARTDAGPCG